MSNCTDKRYEQMLHAYELGLLSDDDRRKLEIHLMECPFCFDRAQSMEAAVRLLNDDQDVQKSIRRISEEKPQKEITRSIMPRDSRKKWWSHLTPAYVAAAAVLLFIILKPWEIEIRPTQEAVAAQNRVAVMYFDNLADPQDPQRLGPVTANLLITDLSESRYMQVVSSQRLSDILRLLGADSAGVLDWDVAAQVADHAKAKWVLMGSILQTDPNIVLTVQLADATTGDILVSQRFIGDAHESIFSLVDKVTVAVKDHLSLPEAARVEPDRQIADVTTHSAEAYRHYVNGCDLYRKYYLNEATAEFEKAVALDTTFAMAYQALAVLKDRQFIDKAVRYSHNASDKDQHYIRATQASFAGNSDSAIKELQSLLQRYPDEKEALYSLSSYAYQRQDYNLALDYLGRAIEVDPLFKQAHNLQAYVYDRLGDVDRAIAAINTYISIAPDEANPYDSKADIYARNGMLDEAIASYTKAVEIKPDYWNSQMLLGHMLLFKGEYEKAEEHYRAVVVGADQYNRSASRLYLSYLPTIQGKFEQALGVVDDAIGADRMVEAFGEQSFKQLFRATIYVEQGKRTSAMEEARQSMQLFREAYPGAVTSYQMQYYIQLLAEDGQLDSAMQIAQDIKRTADSAGRSLADYCFARGNIAFADGDFELSVDWHEKVAAEEIGDKFPVRFSRARAYQESGKLDEAAEEFEKLLTTYTSWRALWAIMSAKLHYYLGMTYEGLGRNADAAGQYEKFLEIWADADSGLVAKEDAQRRLTRLKASL